MNTSVKFPAMLAVLMLAGVILSGCTTAPNPGPQTPPATASGALFSKGDVVRNPAGSATTAWLILSYDPAADTYQRALIYRNADGSWGYRVDTSTETSSRAVMEKVYTEKITTLPLSSVTVKKPSPVPTRSLTSVTTTRATTTTTVTTTTAGTAKPQIKNINPDSGTAGTQVSITDLTGNYFRSGATVTLSREGSQNITATNVQVVSPTRITCTFSLPAGAAAGSWDVVVTNPDGQSATYTNIFSMHVSTTSTTTTQGTSGGVTIASIDPAISSPGSYITPRISGSNIKSGAVVKLVKSGHADITGSNAYMPVENVIQVSFSLPMGSQGAWDLVITNTDGSTGTLVNGFTVTG